MIVVKRQIINNGGKSSKPVLESLLTTIHSKAILLLVLHQRLV